jgi:ABC-2 type transport system permease protein
MQNLRRASNMKKTKLITLIKYEFLNTIKGFFTPFFGILFPLIMGILLTKTIPLSAPEEFRPLVATAITISVATTIPLIMSLLNFPATFSQEIEQQIIFRLNLFNISLREILTAKLIVFLGIQTFTLILYTAVLALTSSLLLPHWSTFIVLIICLYLLTVIYFLIAFSISMLLKKFGPTYAICMSLYFFIMFIGGSMMVTIDKFPPTLQAIAYTLPSTYIANDFIKFWQTGIVNYNFSPLIQALVFFTAIGIILFIFAKHKNEQTH